MPRHKEDTNVAKAEAAVENTNAAETEAAVEDPLGPMVRIRLFKDNDRYKDDLFVAINGRAFQIKRGIEVEVPEAVWEIIKRSEESDRKTAEMIDNLVNSAR